MFQHDNAPVHTARSMQKWFVEIGVEELDWPAQSPDLNPIEHLWDELERRLRARPNRSTSVPDLTNAVVAEWNQIPAAIFQHLMESLPRRVEAVIAAKECRREFWQGLLAAYLDLCKVFDSVNRDAL